MSATPLCETMTTSSPRLRTAEAAAYLGVAISTLEKLRHYGGGPVYYKLGSRLIAYERADLDEWARLRRCQSTSDEAAHVNLATETPNKRKAEATKPTEPTAEYADVR